MGFVDTFLNLDVLGRTWRLLVEGLLTTLRLGAVSILAGLVAGLLLTLVRLYARRPLRWLAIAYIDVFRAVPLLVVLVLVYYGLPFVGLRLDAFVAATLSLSMVLAAYTAEVCRAGVQAVPRGQFEACEALGLPWAVSMRKVVLPQALRIVVPPNTNNCVSILKDTSLASVVAMPDLLKQATDAQAFAANPTPLVGAALLYLALLLPLVRLVGLLERRLAAPYAPRTEPARRRPVPPLAAGPGEVGRLDAPALPRADER